MYACMYVYIYIYKYILVMLHLPIVILYQQIDKVEKRKQRISHSIDGRTIETITPKQTDHLRDLTKEEILMRFNNYNMKRKDSANR